MIQVKVLGPTYFLSPPRTEIDPARYVSTNIMIFFSVAGLNFNYEMSNGAL